jgi:hypothetical protein
VGAKADPQSKLPGQRGKTIYGNWMPAGSALHDASTYAYIQTQLAPLVY